MSGLIILPLRLRPDVSDLQGKIVPGIPFVAPTPGTLAQRDDIIALYRKYLHRDPEDEGAITGRIGRPLIDVELEIATSDEALGIGLSTPPAPSGTVEPIVPHTITPWGERVGQLLATYMAVELGMAAPPAEAFVPLGIQADIEDAGGTSYGAQTNNPLNLRPREGDPWPGQTGISPGGFSEFDTLDHGAKACALNYTSADSAGYYAAVRGAFLGGDPITLARAIDASPWNAGGYGGRIEAGTRAALAG